MFFNVNVNVVFCGYIFRKFQTEGRSTTPKGRPLAHSLKVRAIGGARARSRVAPLALVAIGHAVAALRTRPHG